MLSRTHTHTHTHTHECYRTHMFWPHYTLQPHLNLLMLKHTHTHTHTDPGAVRLGRAVLDAAGWRQPRAEKKRLQSMSIDMQYCTKTATAQTRRENETRAKSSVRKGEHPLTCGAYSPFEWTIVPRSLLKHNITCSLKCWKYCFIFQPFFFLNNI